LVTDFLPYTVGSVVVKPEVYVKNPEFSQNPESPNNFCLESIRQVMFGIFKGLRDLHSLGITHRDIKSSNILVDNNKYPVSLVKICDLGSSKRLLSDPNDESTQSISYIGTRSFRAPELLVGNKYYDSKIDIWSTAIVFLKLILGYIGKNIGIFEVKDTKQLAKIVSEFIGDPTQTELDEMLAQNKMLSTSVSKGLSDSQIMTKRFLKFD
jgi:serine/threonine protein kinase